MEFVLKINIGSLGREEIFSRSQCAQIISHGFQCPDIKSLFIGFIQRRAFVQFLNPISGKGWESDYIIYQLVTRLLVEIVIMSIRTGQNSRGRGERKNW